MDRLKQHPLMQKFVRDLAQAGSPTHRMLLLEERIQRQALPTADRAVFDFGQKHNFSVMSDPESLHRHEYDQETGLYLPKGK